MTEIPECTECTYDPTVMAGLPIGMFHCPECGCMVLAGLPHGPHDDDEIEPESP